MPTVFIAGLAVPLAPRFDAGDTINETASWWLNTIQHRRVKARLRYMVERNEISPEELQLKAIELCAAEMVPQSTFDDDDTPDPVMEEALAIARELIVARMAQEGLLPPKGLDIHAKALVDAMPEIQNRARFRIEARYRAATQVIEETI